MLSSLYFSSALPRKGVTPGDSFGSFHQSSNAAWRKQQVRMRLDVLNTRLLDRVEEETGPFISKSKRTTGLLLGSSHLFEIPEKRERRSGVFSPVEASQRCSLRNKAHYLTRNVIGQ